MRFHFVNSSENVCLGSPRASNSSGLGNMTGWWYIESGSGAGPTTTAANNADNLLKDHKVGRHMCVCVCVYWHIMNFHNFSCKNVSCTTSYTNGVKTLGENFRYFIEFLWPCGLLAARWVDRKVVTKIFCSTHVGEMNKDTAYFLYGGAGSGYFVQSAPHQ